MVGEKSRCESPERVDPLNVHRDACGDEQESDLQQIGGHGGQRSKPEDGQQHHGDLRQQRIPLPQQQVDVGGQPGIAPDLPGHQTRDRFHDTPPRTMRMATPAIRMAAEPRSWLTATWPFLRASWRRCGVASWVFSPVCSAIVDQGPLLVKAVWMQVEDRFDLFLKRPRDRSQGEEHGGERDERVDAETDGEDIDLWQRAADQGEDQCGQQERRHGRRGSADAEHEALGQDGCGCIDE